MSDCMRLEVNMSEYTSMKTGGVAERCYFPETQEQLCETVAALEDDGAHYAVLGNMSNVLLEDGTLSFVPVVTCGVRGRRLEKRADGKAELYAACGESLTRLAYDMCREGLSGLEFAYGIPGTVGGAVFMNAGAYGSEMKNVVCAVHWYDIAARQTVEIPADACAFGYRNSVFQQRRGVILGAHLLLSTDDAESCLARAKAFMKRRTEKQPLELPSCGSAFKRPEGFYAGELIEKSGLKGFCVGGACVSEKHAGFIVNKGGATTADVIGLIEEVQARVKARFGVELEPEIRIIK